MDYEAIGSKLHELGKRLPYTVDGHLLIQAKLTNLGVKIMVLRPLPRGHSESVSRVVSWLAISDSKVDDVFGHTIAVLLAKHVKEGTPQ